MLELPRPDLRVGDEVVQVASADANHPTELEGGQAALVDELVQRPKSDSQSGVGVLGAKPLTSSAFRHLAMIARGNSAALRYAAQGHPTSGTRPAPEPSFLRPIFSSAARRFARAAHRVEESDCTSPL